LAPEFAIAHGNLAIGYMEKGDFASAIVHADKAKDLGYEVPEPILAELEPHR
jgi:hypothetical protein